MPEDEGTAWAGAGPRGRPPSAPVSSQRPHRKLPITLSVLETDSERRTATGFGEDRAGTGRRRCNSVDAEAESRAEGCDNTEEHPGQQSTWSHVVLLRGNSLGADRGPLTATPLDDVRTCP